MLANAITQLVDGFIVHYDAENPPIIKFRGIRNAVLGSWASRGWQGWQTGAVIEIGQQLRIFVENRGKFILEKLLLVITDIQVEYYADLNDDCKNYIATKISVQPAKAYLEQIRIEANAATGVTVETSRALDNVLMGFNAEIEFFCAKYRTKSTLKEPKVNVDTQGKQATANMVFNIDTVQGAVGNISHSPININPQMSPGEIVNETDKQVQNITDKIISEKSPELLKAKNPKCVFVVHGRNMTMRDSMFTFLRAIGLQPLEWSQAVQATGEGSPYIGHVLDTAFLMAQAIVVLMTPDDEARLRTEFHSTHEERFETQFTPQARPNVLFEAGMAMGRNPKRTVLVQVGQLRPFSDIGGRHVLRLNNASPSRQELANRLKTAGCEIDLSGTDWHSVGSFTDAPSSVEQNDNALRPEIDNQSIQWRQTLLQTIAGLKLRMMRLQPGEWYPIFEQSIVEIAQMVVIMPKSIHAEKRDEITAIVERTTKMTDSQVVYGSGEVFAGLERIEALVRD